MRPTHILPILAVAPSSLAVLLDLFARDHCMPNTCYRAVRAASDNASTDCYASALPTYASSCRDTSRFSSACSCLGIKAASSTTATHPTTLIPDKEVSSTFISITTTFEPSPTCVATTWTGTVTSISTSIQTSIIRQTLTVTAAAAASTTTLNPAVSQVICQPSTCLADPQATNMVDAFHNLLTNPDRSAINTDAETLIAEEFFEMSGSVNSLAGNDVKNTTFPSRSAYLASLSAAQAIPMMTTLDIFHDCNRIAWYWAVSNLGSDKDEVRGVSLLYTIPGALEAAAVGVADGGNMVAGNVDFGNRKISMVMLEFNNVAWAGDTGRVLCSGWCGL